MRNAQVRILSAPSSTTINGPQTDVGQAVSASFVANSTDTSTAGTIKLQCCNQNTAPQDRQNFVGTIWADIPNATTTMASGVAPAIVIGNMAFSFIRAVFTHTSGGSSAPVTVDMDVLSI